MFDLDSAIAVWREQLARGGISSPEILDELESHLREEIDQQIQSGVGPQQAFDEAVHRFGEANALRKELKKAGAMPPTRQQAFLRKLCYVSAGFAVLINACYFFLHDVSAKDRLLGLAGIALTALYLCSLPYFYRLCSEMQNRWGKLATQIVVILAWLICGVLIIVLIVPYLGILSAPIAISLWGMISIVAVLAWISYRVDDDVAGWSRLVLSGANSGQHPLLPNANSPFPPLDKFTSNVRQALEFAREEALAFKHDFIGTEHLLLGLLKVDEGATASLLQKIDLSREVVRTEVINIVGAWSIQPTTNALRCTPRSMQALEFAAKEAESLKHRDVGPEHLLFGLLRQRDGVAGRVLRKLGVDIEAVRKRVLKNLDQNERES